MAQKKKSNKLLYILIVVVVLLIIVLIVGKKKGLIGGEKEIEVELAKVDEITIVEKVSASGMVQPVTEVKLSPDVAGEIIELTVEEGDSVRMNQLLVKIRPDNFISALERARATLNQQKANYHSSLAALSKAEANFTRTEADYKRQKQLFDEKVISEADWQLAEQNYKIAENDIKSAKQNVEAARYIVKSGEASVNEAQENVRLTSVLAPMNGIVSKLSVEKGERVVGTRQMAGTEMLRIADLNKMEIRVDVNENDIIRVSLGDTAIIDVDAYSQREKKFKGIVTQIANTANDKASSDAVTEFEVRILILNSSYLDLIKEGKRYPFRPGMTASVDIITERKENVLSVALGAVTTRTDKDFKEKGNGEKSDESGDKVESSENKKEGEESIECVFVNNEGVATLRKVKTGISDYDNIEILEGLEIGDEVVVGPFLAVSKRLKNGDLIKSNKDNKESKDKDSETKEEEGQ